MAWYKFDAPIRHPKVYQRTDNKYKVKSDQWSERVCDAGRVYDAVTKTSGEPYRDIVTRPAITYNKVTGMWEQATATDYVASYSAGNQAKLVRADGRKRIEQAQAAASGRVNRHASGS